MRSLLALALFATSLAAAVDGTVMNRTAGKPQAGALVTLYKLGEAGMQPVSAAKSGAEGKFRFEETIQGPHLLQTIYSGVTYTQMIPPGSPSSGLTVEVFDTSAKPDSAKVSQHMILLEPAENRLVVSENILYQNSGNRTYNDPAGGTVKVFLPETAKGEARVMVTAPGGMPVQRSLSKTSQANVFKIDFPVKPGETRFDISYSVPFSSPGSFASKVLEKDSPVRLIVPAGVTLAGDGLEPLGQEPSTQASIFGVKGQEFKVEIQGTGALQQPAEGADDSGPGFEQILPRIYDRVEWIVGLSLAILMLGLVLLYRRTETPATAAQPEATTHKGKRRG